MVKNYKQGTLIRDARIKKFMSQQELAELLDVANVTISRWETGYATPSHKNRKKLYQILEVELPLR